MAHVGQVFVQIQHYRNEGRGWRFIADMLNMGGVGAPRDGVWYPTKGTSPILVKMHCKTPPSFQLPA